MAKIGKIQSTGEGRITVNIRPCSGLFIFAALNPIFPALEYCRYRFKARDAHGLHSPFLYELYESVILDETPFYAYGLIESLRAKMIRSEQVIEVTDYGTGGEPSGRTRRLGVSFIARKFVQSRRYGQLLFRLVNHFRPEKILELGTSLGITTLYLAAPSGSSEVWTLEGCPETAAIARSNFEAVNAPHIRGVTGAFHQTLPGVLDRMSRLDFAYIDGNHSYEPTLDYFRLCLPYTHENTILVFDDIHWSPAMQRAWEVIRNDPAVSVSLDLYQFGILFFRKGHSRQHFTLKY